MLMQIDGTFIFVIISFLIFLFIIKAILYAPITRIIDERENFYNKNSKIEEASKEKSRLLLLEKEEKLNAARLLAQKETNQALDEAKFKSEEIIQKAKDENKTRIETVQNQLKEESNFTKNEITKDISYLVSSIVSKVLKEDIEINCSYDEVKKYLKI